MQNKIASGETSQVIRERVSAVRSQQYQQRGKLNSQLLSHELEEHCGLKEADQRFLAMVCEKLNMSARAYHRILKLARTIADMAGQRLIDRTHLSEAVGLRSLDRR
jgi:magnesium chelatase family protein